AQTVAAITPVAVAANCLVVVEGCIRKGCGTAGDIEAGAKAIAAVGPSRAVAAQSLVVRELAVQDGEDATAPDTAARTEAGTGGAGPGGTPAGLVVSQHTAQDRQPRQAAKVQGVGRRALV